MTDTPDPKPGPELQALLDECYTPDEQALWLKSPQPLFNNAISQQMISDGREGELIGALRSMLEGNYL